MEGSAEPVFVDGKILFNLVSKPTFWSKPKVGCLRDCIISMHAHASVFGIRDIAVPLLGSGHDKLDFETDVYPILEEVFGGSKVHLHIYRQGRHGIDRFDLVYLSFLVIYNKRYIHYAVFTLSQHNLNVH